jgi:hypothetical protein
MQAQENSCNIYALIFQSAASTCGSDVLDDCKCIRVGSMTLRGWAIAIRTLGPAGNTTLTCLLLADMATCSLLASGMGLVVLRAIAAFFAALGILTAWWDHHGDSHSLSS